MMKCTVPSTSPIYTRLAALFLAVVATAIIAMTETAKAMKIQEVTSPGGIKAWLVEEHRVPLLALRFAFMGGSAQDPDQKPGVGHFLTVLLDEGAGDMNASAFQDRAEELAMKMSFDATRDHFYGSFQTLTTNRKAAVEMLRLALNEPRLDKDAIERMRGQLIASLDYADRDPAKVASRVWFAKAFPDHAYGRPSRGTKASMAAITRADILDYRKRVFAKDTLKVAAVGDIDAKTLGVLIDRIFGDLPAKSDLKPVPQTSPASAGAPHVVDMNVPQSVARFGLPSFPRSDPDFIPAYVINYILGGGGFTSRLMVEVREKRGLAYSVWSYLIPLRKASIYLGGVATKNDAMGTSLDVIRTELKRMAKSGPSAQELAAAKKYLTGSYPLRFDTSSKIASQLLAVQVAELGLDYIKTRNAKIEAVSNDDVKRVAKRLFGSGRLLEAVVGKPTNLTPDKG